MMAHPIPPACIAKMLTLVLTVAPVLSLMTASELQAVEPAIDFNRDVRPVLSDRCFACHGPDEAKRKGGLRLDVREGALAAGDSGKAAVVPGSPERSELIRRLTTDDADERMPPAKANKTVSAAEADLLRRWIAEGARWSEHWLWSPLSQPQPPAAMSGQPWCRNPVDAFVLARLRAAGVEPAPEADRETLIRRLSFDLTGLPPTPDEVDAFVADTSPQAYERVVDRLLASPRYGERMAVHWLDQVRYADTIGYHSDVPMPVTPYRDYVIASFNDDVPFDRFTREQIAGDLLPDKTLRTRVASAYNRLVKSTEEGGAQPKDYEAKMGADRVRNLGSTWLGSTIGCAECHNHKYDPFTAADFYAMKAFFADVQERATGSRKGAITVPTPDLEAKTALIEAEIASALEVRDTRAATLDASRVAWEAATRTALLAKSKRLNDDESDEAGPSAKSPAGSKPKKSDPRKNDPNDLGLPRKVAEALRREPASRDQTQIEAVAAHWLSTAPELSEINIRINAAQKRLAVVAKGMATCLVTQSAQPRVVRILPRGDWQNESGAVVEPAVPHFLPQIAKAKAKARASRLDLADWLVGEENAITPRVAANRLWRLLFGHGLSRRMDDLGTQGEAPTHPELLDWLASTYRSGRWRTKPFMKLLAMSAAYRQESKPVGDLAVRDPDNRLYARQSRVPLDAEMVRDAALAIAGLLDRPIGGISVFPYQPQGYWAHLNFPRRNYPTSSGSALHRRTLYTHWQRTNLHPMLLAFDATTREECVSARSRSNIPQQALTLLNDPQFVEAARVFAALLLGKPATDDRLRATTAFRMVLSRSPTADEVQVLVDLVVRHRAQYANDKPAAQALLRVGTTAVPAGLDPAELAAWTSVTRTLLNLHTTMSRY